MIEALRKIEGERYYCLSGLAHELGISTGHLSMIFRGQRQPGLRFVRAVMESFPEIRRLIARSLQAPSEDDVPCDRESEIVSGNANLGA